MSGGASRLNNQLRHPVFLIAFFFVFIPAGVLRADAFLAEDRVYYGADTYSVNYEDEIIIATGHAFFRRQQTDVRARKIVIHYAEEMKKAFLYDDVIVVNAEKGREVRGMYGESHYREDFHLVEGNASYSDDERTVTSRRIESWRWEHYRFIDDVVYSDADVRIFAGALDVDEERRAHFKSDVHAYFIESGDELYCDSITHDMDTGDSQFQGRVVFIQHGEEEGDEGMIVNSEVVKYFHDSDHFLLLDEVFLMSGKYSVRGTIAKYFRKERMVESIGETIVFDGKNTVYCDRMKLDLDSKKISFMGSVRGLFSVSGE